MPENDKLTKKRTKAKARMADRANGFDLKSYAAPSDRKQKVEGQGCFGKTEMRTDGNNKVIVKTKGDLESDFQREAELADIAYHSAEKLDERPRIAPPHHVEASHEGGAIDTIVMDLMESGDVRRMARALDRAVQA